MPSISERFAERRSEGRSTLVPYVTSGFPSRSATLDVLAGLAEAGGDVLELGIPFSDPLAESPTIQDATFRALGGGQRGRSVRGGPRGAPRGKKSVGGLAIGVGPAGEAELSRLAGQNDWSVAWMVRKAVSEFVARNANQDQPVLPLHRGGGSGANA